MVGCRDKSKAGYLRQVLRKERESRMAGFECCGPPSAVEAPFEFKLQVADVLSGFCYAAIYCAGVVGRRLDATHSGLSSALSPNLPKALTVW
jgi:hypothetical protein